MNSFAYIALFGWIPISIFLFAFFPARRALIICIFAGQMFLPVGFLKVQGIPPFSKDFSVAVGALLGALIFHPNQFLAFRPRWFDIPMLAFLISPSLASLTNDLGEYDAFSAFFQYLTFWGFAYVLGRVFFSSLPAVEELAIAFATAGLIY